MNNQKQCAYWTLTINENASCFNNLQYILNLLVDDNPNIEYSYIKHNADDDDKNLHYHLVIYFKGKVKRFSSIQNIFEGSHIEMTNQQRYKRCIQYLIHKNNPEKQQYSSSDIISNLEKSYLDDILNGGGYDFELFQEEKIFDYMADFMKNDGRLTMQQFILRFGLGAITKYYFVIKDQIKEYNELFNAVKLRNRQIDDLHKAFDILNPTLYNEWKVYQSMGGELDLTKYREMVYDDYLQKVELGFINVNEILNRKEV